MKKLLNWAKHGLTSLQARTATISFWGIVGVIVLGIFAYGANYRHLEASMDNAFSPKVYRENFYTLVSTRKDSIKGIVTTGCKSVKITVIVANDSLTMFSSDSSIMRELKGKVMGVDETKHVLYVFLKNSEILGVGKYIFEDFPQKEQQILVLKYGLLGDITILSQSKDCFKVLKRIGK